MKTNITQLIVLDRRKLERDASRTVAVLTRPTGRQSHPTNLCINFDVYFLPIHSGQFRYALESKRHQATESHWNQSGTDQLKVGKSKLGSVASWNTQRRGNRFLVIS